MAATAIGAMASSEAAKQQNLAITKAIQSQADATRIQQRQLAAQTGLEKQKVQQEAQTLVGRLRVAAGESGVGVGGSALANMRQVTLDSATNQEILDRNFLNSMAALRSQFEAEKIRLSSGLQDPSTAAMLGGLQGLQTDLAIIGTGINIAGALSKPKPEGTNE